MNKIIETIKQHKRLYKALKICKVIINIAVYVFAFTMALLLIIGNSMNDNKQVKPITYLDKPTQQLTDNGNNSVTINGDEFLSSAYQTWFVTRYGTSSYTNTYQSLNVTWSYSVNGVNSGTYTTSYLRINHLSSYNGFYYFYFQTINSNNYSSGSYQRFYWSALSNGTYFGQNSVYTSSNETYYVVPYEFTFNNLSNSDYNALKNLFSSSGGYTEEDVEVAYDEGYNVGTSEGYETGYSEGYDYGKNYYVPPISDEEIAITYNYDFRKWYASDIDVNTGIFKIPSITGVSHNDVVVYQYITTGGEWYIGNKKYNAIVNSVISLHDDNYIKLLDGTYKSVSDLVPSTEVYYGQLYTHYVYYETLPTQTGWKNASTYNYLTNADYSLKVQSVYAEGLTGDTSGLTPSTYISFTTPTWLDSGFRFLNHYSSNNAVVSVPNINTLTLIQLLSLNDETATTDITAVTNMFTMLQQAFNGIGGILNIYILPGMTLGVLLFIPLVVSVIVIIIKLLRK